MKTNGFITGSHCNPFNWIRKNGKTRYIWYIMILLILNLTSGCLYYRVTSLNSFNSKVIKNLNDPARYIILHYKDKIWHFQNISIRNDTLFGSLESVQGHDKYKTTKPNRINRYKSTKNCVINELHLYSDSIVTNNMTIAAVPVNEIIKIEIYNPDAGATIVFFILGSVLTLGALIIFILLTKNSCPFIYVYDGNSYQFCGEIYSGAIHPPLERDDYLALDSLKSSDRKYMIKITNEVREIQNTNLAELWMFDHPGNCSVLVDKYGKEHTVIEPAAPLQAFNLIGKDVKQLINKKDTLNYISTPLSKDNPLKDGIILSFSNQKNSDSAKLVIRAKNTFWLDYVFGQFYEMFGIAYNRWMEKQKTVPAKELKDWSLSQNIPLSVYIEKKGKWEFVDYFNVIGPMAYKDDVMKMSLKDIESDSIRIKLEFGFCFWDIDYAGLDFSKDIKTEKVVLSLNEAKDKNGTDLKNLLIKDDTLYYIQPDVGDEAILKFAAPDLKLEKRTILLHSKGHYQILKNPSGIPDRKYLETFSNPGRFNQYSNELIEKYSSVGHTN
jgi:hypothetical protein